MKYPDEIRSILEKKYRAHFRYWSTRNGAWPLAISLSPPTENAAKEKMDTFKAWTDAWKSWRGPGSVLWKDVLWKTFGTQSLPVRIEFPTPETVASFLGKTEHWSKHIQRRQSLGERWDRLESAIERLVRAGHDFTEGDLELLVSTIEWLEQNPMSNLYPRQVPVPGIDSKWVERHESLIRAGLNPGEEKLTSDVFELTGLRRPPRQIRVRILDPRLRTQLSGLSDLSAVPEEINQWKFPIETVFIVENLQTGLAFEDLQGAVVFMALGNAVDALMPINWLHDANCFYWGDIDTHGFFILNQLRSFLPNARSVLMDETTLLEHETLWAREPRQHQSVLLARLTSDERSTAEGIRNHKWSTNLRLEQERIPWSYAWRRITEAISK